MQNVFTLLLALGVTACAVNPVKDAPLLTAIKHADIEQSKELDLGPTVSRIPITQSLVNIQYGWFCEKAPPRRIASGQLPIAQEDLNRAFRAVFSPLRYKLSPVPDSVFATKNTSELVLGATITAFESNLCFPFSGHPSLTVGNTSSVKGSTFIGITWELFSVAENRVVYKISTEGRFESKDTVEGGFATMAVNALVANLNNLAADPSFHSVTKRQSVSL